MAFWAAVVLGLGAAGIALTAGREVGQVGALLLILLFAAGMVLFVFMSRGAGRVLGPFPERGAMETLALANAKTDLVLLDAMDEAALVTDRNLSPIAANHAYLTLAEIAGALGDSDRPPVMSRLFGADPMLSAPMFRLSKAAGMGLSRREELPPTTLSSGGEAVRYEASVGAMPGGRVLWRLRQIGVAEEGAAAEEQRPLFLDDAPIGFFVARPDGQIQYMNRALRAVLGVGDDPNKLRVRDFVKEDGAKFLRRERRSFGATRAPVTLRARDGVETRAQALTFVALGADADSAMRTLVFFADDEAPFAPPQAEQTGARPVAAPDIVFQHAPFGAAVLDSADPATASILDANPALMDMTSGRAAPGAHFADLFDASEGANALTQRLRAAGADPIELQLAGASSASVHVQFARGVEGGAIAYVVNVSDQRELEQRLAQSEKMREIGELAAGVAHDFNNLLTVVMQTCGSLLLRHPVGDADYPLLREIRDHATSAQELSEMLRAYARQQTFKREVVKVADFIGERQELIRRVMGAAISFDLKHGRDLPYVKVDKTQIERVLVNLATNARDAMTPKGGGIPRDGRLAIRTARTTAQEARALGHHPIEDGVYALIEIQDSGMGIKPEHQAKIFRPFHTTKEQGKGTGLGLASCYGIVKQSGGYIFFESRVGAGTTFRIYLPEYEPTPDEIEQMAERERAALNRPSKDVSGRGRILFVEDQAGVRRAIARNLVECGYEVVEAEHGEEALEILGRTPGGFDVIISDESMPVMSGSEMIEHAGPEMIGGARVLFLSGYAPESFSKILEDYRVSYMSKPVTMEQLVQRVKDLLAA